MGVPIKEIIITVSVSLALNFFLLMYANATGSINCPVYKFDYETESLTLQNQTVDLGYKDIVRMSMGQCSGIPLILIWIFELPLLVGLFYIIRAFVGAT